MNDPNLFPAHTLELSGTFEDRANRSLLLVSLQPQTSFMSFEGAQVQGAEKILEKLQVNPTSKMMSPVHLQ